MIINGYENPRKQINQIAINCCFFGYAAVGQEWHSDFFVSNFTRIYIITEGKAVLADYRGNYTVSAGDIAVIPAGTAFSYRCDKYMEKAFFHVQYAYNGGDVFNALHGISVLKQGDFPDFCGCLNENGDPVLLQCGLYSIMQKCMHSKNFHSEELQRVISPLTTKAIHFIRENLSARLRVGVVAEAMFVSISSLQKHFKKELSMSVGEYIERELFAEAEKYVLHTAKSVDQISTALHFCDATYFSKRFKQRFFKSPLQYRRAQAAK